MPSTQQPEATTAVDVRDLYVVRGGRDVLNRISCRISAGTVNGVLGPNGSGKTTLLRSIVGAQIVRSGTVTVLGQAAGSPSLRDQIGYSTQSPAVYQDLTVRENLRYFASVLRVSKSDVDRVMDQVGLTRLGGQLAGRLSGGELSRASLAVAMLGTPRLLVLDEPTVGLDPVLRHDLWTLFHRLADTGVTMLISSHVMDEASRCDRLLLLRDGTILADGSPDELRGRTGAADLEHAFLRLVDRAETGVERL